jgi:hypothetical protein
MDEFHPLKNGQMFAFITTYANMNSWPSSSGASMVPNPKIFESMYN